MDNFITENLAKGSTIGMFVSIGILFYKLSPITMITSSSIERKLYSKEKNFLYSIIYGIGLIIYFSMFICFISYEIFTMNINYNFKFFYIFLLIGLLLDVILVFIKREIKFIYIYTFIMYWILVWSYYLGTYIFADELPKVNNVYNYIIILLTASFIIGIFTLICIFPITLWREKYRVQYSVEIDDTKWYLLHSSNNDRFILGDTYKPNRCNKYKVIEIEELLKNVIISEKPDVKDILKDKNNACEAKENVTNLQEKEDFYEI